MKVLLIGQFEHYSIENYFVRYFNPKDTLLTFGGENIFSEFYHASVLNKVRFRLGFSNIYQKVARQLLERAEEVKPDVALVFKGMSILPEALKALKNKGIVLANYNADDPFEFFSAGTGNRNVTDSLGLYDLFFTYSRRLQERIERELKVPAEFLPFGYELSEELFGQLQNIPEKQGVCFIGNPDKVRVQHVMALVKQGLPVDVYGHGWHRFLSAMPNLAIYDAVYGEDFWKKIPAYRVQLNVFRPHNNGSHNMRTFEIPAAGGIQLAPDSAEHRDFFTPEKEIFLYKNTAEMGEIARHILDLPLVKANEIRQNARKSVYFFRLFLPGQGFAGGSAIKEVDKG